LRKSWIAKAAHPTDVGIGVGEATMRRRYITGLMLGAGLASGRAGAQTFPSKQITLVVPFTDVSSFFSDRLSALQSELSTKANICTQSHQLGDRAPELIERGRVSSDVP
jgi:hypothetical protein